MFHSLDNYYILWWQCGRKVWQSHQRNVLRGNSTFANQIVLSLECDERNDVHYIVHLSGLFPVVLNVLVQFVRCHVLLLADFCLWTIATFKGSCSIDILIGSSNNNIDRSLQEIMKSLMELSASLDTYRPNSAALFRSTSGNSKSELIAHDSKFYGV